jgi:putative membrane protein
MEVQNLLSILLSILISSVAVFVTASILPGVHVDSFGTAIVAAIVLGLINTFIRPILLLLTLPINHCPFSDAGLCSSARL